MAYPELVYNLTRSYINERSRAQHERCTNISDILVRFGGEVDGGYHFGNITRQTVDATRCEGYRLDLLRGDLPSADAQSFSAAEFNPDGAESSILKYNYTLHCNV